MNRSKICPSVQRRAAYVLSGAAMIASAHGTIYAQPAVPRWKGIVDLTIGGENAVDGADFGRISGLTVDAQGRVYIADNQDSQIRVFSPKGALVTKIGREGSGPLEFKQLATIAIGPEGLLWVRDEGNRRMLALNVSRLPATNAKTVVFSAFTNGSRLPIVFERPGEIVDESILFDQNLKTFRPMRLRHAVDGTVARTDTLAIPEGAFAGIHKAMTPMKDDKGATIGVAEKYVRQPFGPTWIRANGPGGVRADAVTSRYAVRIYDGQGKLLRTLSRTVAPVPLSPAEKRKADSLIKAPAVDLPFGVPSAKPPIQGLYYSQEGMLWVERAVADGQPREADVFDTNGRLVAIATWPQSVELTSMYNIRGQTLHVMLYDADEQQRVVRLQFR